MSLTKYKLIFKKTDNRYFAIDFQIKNIRNHSKSDLFRKCITINTPMNDSIVAL